MRDNRNAVRTVGHIAAAGRLYEGTGSPQPPLLRVVETALRRHAIAATTFGKAAIGDPRLVATLRLGREPRPQTVARVRAYLARLATEADHGE